MSDGSNNIDNAAIAAASAFAGVHVMNSTMNNSGSSADYDELDPIVDNNKATGTASHTQDTQTSSQRTKTAPSAEQENKVTKEEKASSSDMHTSKKVDATSDGKILYKNFVDEKTKSEQLWKRIAPPNTENIPRYIAGQSKDILTAESKGIYAGVAGPHPTAITPLKNNTGNKNYFKDENFYKDLRYEQSKDRRIILPEGNKNYFKDSSLTEITKPKQGPDPNSDKKPSNKAKWGKRAGFMGVSMAVLGAAGLAVNTLMINDKGRMNNAQMYGQQPYSQY